MSKIKAFAKETLIYGFANVFSRAFAMFLIPLYTNFLGKIDYSNLIMLQSLFTLITFLLALNSGVFFYFYEYDNEKYKKMVFTSWFYYQIILSAIILGLLILLSPYLKEIFLVTSSNSDILSTALILIGIQLFPYIINITNNNFYRVKREAKSVLKLTFLESLFTLLFIGLGFLLLDFGIIEIFLAQILARSLVSIIYFKNALYFIRIKNFSAALLKKLVSFSWPFFIVSSFSWLIISIDKFVGANTLQDKEDVALLALAMQLTIPIAILADMIRMAIGPFVMSIRKEKDAEKSYQQIFDVSVYSSSMILIGLVMITPLAVFILANPSFMKVLKVVPLIAFASVLSLMYNQLAISFSLSKKNVYIMYATIIGGVLGYSMNKMYMYEFGFIVSGVSQIIAYSVMVVFLYFVGRKLTDSELNLKHTIQILGMVSLYMAFIFFKMNDILNGNYLILFLSGITAMIIVSILFIYQQDISWLRIKRMLIHRT